MSPSDETAALMARPGTGRDTSMAALMALHDRDVRSALRKVLGRSRDEDDLVQEVFTRLVVRLRQPGDVNVGAWVRGVARNLAVDEIRRRRPVPVEQVHLDRAYTNPADDGVVGGELYSCLVEGAQRLPGRQREALAAALAGGPAGAGTAGVASSLGVSVHAAESLLSRARVGMRAHLVTAGHGADAGSLRLSVGAALGAVMAVLAGLARRWRAVSVVLAMAGGAVSLTGAVVLPALDSPPPAVSPVVTGPAGATAAASPIPAGGDQPGVDGAAVGGAGAAGAAALSPAPAGQPAADASEPATVPVGGAPALVPLPPLPAPADLGLDLPTEDPCAALPQSLEVPLAGALLDPVTDAVRDTCAAAG